MFVQFVCLTFVALAAMAAAAPKSEQSVQPVGSVDELKLRLLDRLLSELAAAEQLDADYVRRCGYSENSLLTSI